MDDKSQTTKESGASAKAGSIPPPPTNSRMASQLKPEDYFSHNEHGYWCDNCGCLVKQTLLSDDHEEIPEFCPDCGFPEVTQEWVGANT